MAASTFDDQLTWPKVGKNRRTSADAQPPTQPPIKCPECGSSRIWKNGLRYARSETGGEITLQRYICRDCGRRFSEDPGQGSYLHSNKHVFNVSSGLSTCQVSVTRTEGTKNLSHQRTRQKQAAGATKPSPEEIKGKIVEYSWYLKKQGYANGTDGDEGTVQKWTKILKRLVKLGANLWDPENVKEVIATQENWGDAYKVQIKYAYKAFLKMEGLTWDPPRYKQPQTIPFVPMESEIDCLINACGKKASIFVQGLKETGADPGEVWRAEWTDINEKAKAISIKHPVKGHNPRILPISRDLIARFQLLPKGANRIFPMKLQCMRTNFWHQRKRIAKKLANPRLLKLTFTSIRHWKATMEYHRTRDILYVKQLLGHKNLSSTMVYIDIEKALYGNNENDEFISRVATSLKGARVLIEAGFEYITDIDDYKLFRKRRSSLEYKPNSKNMSKTFLALNVVTSPRKSSSFFVLLEEWF